MQLLPLRRTMVCSARLANLGASFFRGVTLPFTRHYWFAPGCKRSYQFARYAFALLYLYLAYLWLGYFGTVTDIGNYVDAFLIVNNPNLYRPISVFHFLGNSLPPALFLKLCLVLLKWCPITLLFGVFSRASLAGCILGLFGLSFIQYSYSPQWSHGFSPILVASLVFLLGPRHHDGFDGWWRRRTGRTWTPADDHRARAAVMAAQMMIALVFLNAAFFKVYAYGEGLRGFLPSPPFSRFTPTARACAASCPGSSRTTSATPSSASTSCSTSRCASPSALS